MMPTKPPNVASTKEPTATPAASPTGTGKRLTYTGEENNSPYGECEGDCDSSGDCDVSWNYKSDRIVAWLSQPYTVSSAKTYCDSGDSTASRDQALKVSQDAVETGLVVKTTVMRLLRESSFS
jgi:hypothetical protein